MRRPETKEVARRDGRATRIPPEPEAERIAALLADEATTKGQRQIIGLGLRELSEGTGVSLTEPDGTLRGFYLAAGYRLGAAGARHRLRIVLALIAGGERFDDYKTGDTYWRWKQKRAHREHSTVKSTSAELERRLSDPKTPGDYREVITRELRALCAAAETPYDESDPADSYREATAEIEGVQSLTPKWHALFNARCNVLSLLYGLRKRLPLASVELRRDDERPEPKADKGSRLSELRDLLRHLGDDITDCSERMRLEKEVFDIEHPKDPDWNDWSAWEEGGAE